MTDYVFLDWSNCCLCYCPKRNNINILPQENNHLLRVPSTLHRNRLQIFWLVCLGLILVVGLTVGIYLLCREGEEEASVQITLDKKAKQGAILSRMNRTQLKYPLDKVKISPIFSPNIDCDNVTSCDMYNFIMHSDGRLFEGRGWNYLPGAATDDASILSIGLLENSDYLPFSNQQFDGLIAFLDVAVNDKKLMPCFHLEGKNLTQDMFVVLKKRRPC